MREANEVISLIKAYQTATGKENNEAPAEENVVDLSVQATLGELSKLKPEDLPKTITEQFDKIAILEEKVKAAKTNANTAKEKANDAKKGSLSFFQRKTTIESLQVATDNLATSQGSIVDALDASFDYQQQLGQITQFLFILGVSNIAGTRSVVQQLKDELKKSSSKGLSNTAKTEILSIIKQLEAQEDMANRIEKTIREILER